MLLFHILRIIRPKKIIKSQRLHSVLLPFVLVTLRFTTVKNRYFSTEISA